MTEQSLNLELKSPKCLSLYYQETILLLTETVILRDEIIAVKHISFGENKFGSYVASTVYY